MRGALSELVICLICLSLYFYLLLIVTQKVDEMASENQLKPIQIRDQLRASLSAS